MYSFGHLTGQLSVYTITGMCSQLNRNTSKNAVRRAYAMQHMIDITFTSKPHDPTSWGCVCVCVANKPLVHAITHRIASNTRNKSNCPYGGLTHAPPPPLGNIGIFENDPQHAHSKTICAGEKRCQVARARVNERMLPCRGVACAPVMQLLNDISIQKSVPHMHSV